MFSLKQLLTAALVSGGLSRTWACSCLPGSGALCDGVQGADAVLQVKAVSRVEGLDINDDAVYTLETISVFQAEEPGPNPYDEVGATFQMTTGGNSGLCGVFMRTDGTEYLLDMSRASDGTLRAVGICGLFRPWDESYRAELEAGCDDYDPCDGECTEFQECIYNYSYYTTGAYRCVDVCDPSPCPEGEMCTLEYSSTTSDSYPVAVCSGDPPVGGTTPPAPTPAPGGRPQVGGTTPPAPTPAPGGRTRPTESPPTPTLSPDSDRTRPPAPTQAPTAASPPPGERTRPPAPTPAAPTSSQAPTAAGSDSSTSSPTTASGGDGSRVVSFTPAPSAAGVPGAPSVPQTSSAPTVSGANAEGDGETSAAPTLCAAAFTAAAAAAAVAAAASCTVSL